jgi:hypothetical protein
MQSSYKQLMTIAKVYIALLYSNILLFRCLALYKNFFFLVDNCNKNSIITSNSLLSTKFMYFLINISKLVLGLGSKIHNLNMYQVLVLCL